MRSYLPHDGEHAEQGEHRRRPDQQPSPSRWNGAPPTTEGLLAMQRMVGNRAVSGVLGAGQTDVHADGQTDGRGVEDEFADSRQSVQRVPPDAGAPDAGAPRPDAGAPGADAGAAAATPTAVRNGPGHRPIDTAAGAGMSIDITLTSSTGRDADMASILDSEQVSSSLNHTGSYATVPSSRSSNSGYMAGHPIPADQHSEGKARIIDTADNKGGAGSFEREQLDTWKPNAAGTAAAIPSSGYFIKRTIIMNGTGIRFKTEKGPRACTVNGFTTTAGPSGLQSEEVQVRAPAPTPAPPAGGRDAGTP